jgi:hypothetical protein
MSLARFLERAPQGRASPMGVLGPPAAPRAMLSDDPAVIARQRQQQGQPNGASGNPPSGPAPGSTAQ